MMEASWRRGEGGRLGGKGKWAHMRGGASVRTGGSARRPTARAGPLPPLPPPPSSLPALLRAYLRWRRCRCGAVMRVAMPMQLSAEMPCSRSPISASVHLKNARARGVSEREGQRARQLAEAKVRGETHLSNRQHAGEVVATPQPVLQPVRDKRAGPTGPGGDLSTQNCTWSCRPTAAPERNPPILSSGGFGCSARAGRQRGRWYMNRFLPPWLWAAHRRVVELWVLAHHFAQNGSCHRPWHRCARRVTRRAMCARHHSSILSGCPRRRRSGATPNPPFRRTGFQIRRHGRHTAPGSAPTDSGGFTPAGTRSQARVTTPTPALCTGLYATSLLHRFT